MCGKQAARSPRVLGVSLIVTTAPSKLAGESARTRVFPAVGKLAVLSVGGRLLSSAPWAAVAAV